MEKETCLPEMIGTLSEYVDKIYKRRQELQEDAVLMKEIIDKLKLDFSVTPAARPDDDMMNALRKAREERDEYKFQLNDYQKRIIDLKKELDAAKMNQTHHDTSIVARVSNIRDSKSCAHTSELEPGCSSNVSDLGSEEDLRRELCYLHKSNKQFLEQIRKLQLDLSSKEALQEKLNHYEAENKNLRKGIEEKQTKMTDMQIEFDEKSRKAKLHITALNNKIRELEDVRNALKVDLAAVRDEVRVFDLPLKKPVKEVAESSFNEFPDKTVTNSEQKENETSLEKGEILNVNIRRDKRIQRKSIESIDKHEHPTSTSLSDHHSLGEEHQVTVVDIQESYQVSKGMKRGQRGGKETKKKPAASQKQQTKKVKLSDEKNVDPLHNVTNEVMGGSSNTRKGIRTRAVEKGKAPTCSEVKIVTKNKQNKKLVDKLETDENVEPSTIEFSGSSFNDTSEKAKLSENSSTPLLKVPKKVQVEKTKRRKRNY